MSREKKTRFHDLVSGMDGGSFDDLRGEVRARECREWLGEADLSEMAESLGRKPACPECGSLSCRPWGRSKSGERRYVCSDCGRDVPAAEPIGFGLVEEASDGLRQSA
jgi:DNA-directed RNA polymerase subunit RPC12/RpoP